MSIRILAHLHSDFGIPLEKLRHLQTWMLGDIRSPRDESRLNDVSKAAGHYAQEIAGQHPEFADRLLALSDGTVRGMDALRESFLLVDAGLALGDEATAPEGATTSHPLAKAAMVIALATVPLYDAFGLMMNGYPVFLVTNLDDHMLVDELTLVEKTRDGKIASGYIVVNVSDHVNAVLESTIGSTLEAQLLARNLVIEPRLSVEQQASMVLDLIKTQDFDRIIVVNRKGTLRMEVERDLLATDVRDLIKALGEHDFQTITVKKVDGDIVRMTQKILMKPPNDRHGKNPSGRRSSE